MICMHRGVTRSLAAAMTVTALCQVSAVAAEPLVRTRLGVAMGSTQHRGNDSLAGPGGVLEVTTPVSPSVAVGLHVALAYGSQYERDPRAMFTTEIDETFVAAWVGGVLQKELVPGVFFAPWLGVSGGHEDRCNYTVDRAHPQNSVSDCPGSITSKLGLGVGASLAIDLIQSSPHRWQVFVDTSFGLGVESSSALLGIGYRYSCD